MTSVFGFAAGKVVNAVTAVSAFYTEINPATLSGAIDIIVVEQENGDLVSSPFHVRFGKLKVLRPHEKKVEVSVNEQPTDFVMKVGEAGEAFFVVETENPVPSEYATSPLAQPISVDEEGVEPLELGDAAAHPDDNGDSSTNFEFELKVKLLTLTRHSSWLYIPEDDYPSDAASPSHADINGDALGPPTNGHHRHPSQQSSPDTHDLPIDADDVAAAYKHDAALMGIPDGDDVEVFDTPQHTPVDATKDMQELGRDVGYERGVEDVSREIFGGRGRTIMPEEIPLPPSTDGGDESVHASKEEGDAVESERRMDVEHREAEVSGVEQSEGTVKVIAEPASVEDGIVTSDADLPAPKQDTAEAANEATPAELPATDVTPANPESIPHLIEPTITDSPTSSGRASAHDSGIHTPEGKYLPSTVATLGEDLDGTIALSGEDLDDVAETTPVKTLVSPLPVLRPNARRADTLPLGVGKLKERKGVVGKASSVIDGTASEDEYAGYEQDRPKPINKPGPLSDNGVEYQDYAHKPSDPERKGWSWVWGGLPTKAKTGDESPKRSPSKDLPPTTVVTMSVDEKVGSFLAGLPEPEKYDDVLESAKEGGGRPPSPEKEKKKEKEILVGGVDGVEGGEVFSVSLEEGGVIELSLCGYRSLKSLPVEAAENNFVQNQISFEMFCGNPSIINDPNLIVKINGNYYSWAVAGPILLSHMAFGKPLPEETMQKLLKQQILQGKANPDVSRKYSFTHLKSWWSRGSTPAPAVKTPPIGPDGTTPTDAELKLENGEVATIDRNTTAATVESVQDKEETPGVPPSPPASPPPAAALSQEERTADVEDRESDKAPKYAKSLRLTSEQLKALNLKKGPNTITFAVKSGFQGTAICSAKMYLWGIEDKVVISDIDGTITKSDVLGHIFTAVGRDWTHSGVASLYTNIRKNGYQIMYLTSRAIGQASSTRDYLDGVQQGGNVLPEGPIIMSPDRLLKSFHREVILRKPEEFKMACLRDIKRLFGERKPFYAGFGNRITDALSYRSVDVPASRIFSIDSTGEIKLELLATYKSSYIKLNDIVDQIFPPITDPTTTPEYNDWNYWRPSLPEIELDFDFEEGAGGEEEAEEGEEEEGSESRTDEEEDEMSLEEEEEEVEAMPGALPTGPVDGGVVVSGEREGVIVDGGEGEGGEQEGSRESLLTAESGDVGNVEEVVAGAEGEVEGEEGKGQG
ncbi:hypothetical protein HDV00_001104 [Rhizophlyctis rosea]|nr:hypothetical protein HDV00_001104 [Rhizophlyctis rosea]